MTLIYLVGLCCFSSPSILVYGSVDTAAQCLLTLHIPEGCPVLCLKHSSSFLFAGLRNGTMMVYGRNNSGKCVLRLTVTTVVQTVSPAVLGVFFCSIDGMKTEDAYIDTLKIH